MTSFYLFYISHQAVHYSVLIVLQLLTDYLHGVSFHKGCYIGQELTARTHHTGVVRKRIVPLTLSEDVPDSLDLEQVNVLTETGKKVGKIKRLEGRVGLGLLRLKESLEAESLSLEGVGVSVVRPDWWPAEKEDLHSSDLDKR